MGRDVTCDCGRVLPASADLAGWSIACACGRTVHIPSPGPEEGPTPAEAAPPAAPSLPPPAAPPSGPAAEVIPPTSAALRVGRGPPRPVMAALAADAVWIQDAWRLRRVSLQPFNRFWARRDGRELLLTTGPEPLGERLTLRFESADTGRRWLTELEGRRPFVPDGPETDRPTPEGVALVRRAPDVPRVALGRVEFTDRGRRSADRGLQLRAGMCGADAVIQVRREPCRELGWRFHRVSGLAVRVEDPDARRRLRARCYSEAAAGMVKRWLLLLVVQAAIMFLFAVSRRHLWNWYAGAMLMDDSWPAVVLPVLGLCCAWPLVTLGLTWVLRWPPALRAAGLAVLAATTLRVAATWSGHFLAVLSFSPPRPDGGLWVLADPVSWVIAVAGAVLCLRARWLADDARQILPREFQPTSAGGRARSGLLLAASGVYALLLLLLVGRASYDSSAFEFWLDADSRRLDAEFWREREANQALDEGVEAYNRHDLEAADRWLRRSLELREESATGRPAATVDKDGLAITLYDLGLLRQRQGLKDEAEKYYERAVALGDDAADHPAFGEQFRQTIADARAALQGLRDHALITALADEDQAAVRKYEDAQIKAADGDAEAAARLYAEAIALWQEVLPQTDNPEYRKSTVGQIAQAYLHIGEQRQQEGKMAEAEEALKHAIVYARQAADLDPDRPLARRRLETAGRMLDEVEEQALREKINKLCAEERFGEAAVQLRRAVADQETQVQLAADHNAAVRRLAYRLDCWAWFLAHCPDDGVRNTRAAVKQAQRATELQPDAADYRYTFAMVQYRNGEWQNSLDSLEALKARTGAWDARGWLLAAMDHCRLGRRDKAGEALRSAAEWVEKRKAEPDDRLRIQYELMRPAIEQLQREAEDLIQGKDGGGDRVG